MEDRTHCDDAWLYECSACGSFAITDCDAGDARASERVWTGRSRAQLSALLREQAIRPLPPYWVQFGLEPYGPLKLAELVPIDVDELLAQWPRTVPERLDRMLCNLARMSETGGFRVEIRGGDMPLAFAQTPEEELYNARCLVELGYLDDTDSASEVGRLMLTASGWERFEELTQKRNSPAVCNASP